MCHDLGEKKLIALLCSDFCTLFYKMAAVCWQWTGIQLANAGCSEGEGQG